MDCLGLVAIMAAIFAIGNRLRGASSFLVWMPAFFVAAVAYYSKYGITLVTDAPLESLIPIAVLVAAYVGGESWGWTKWINCIKFNLTQEQYNKKWAYPNKGDAPNYEALMQKLLEDGWDQRDYKSYVWVGMFFRGLLWWAPFYMAMWALGMIDVGVALVLACLAAICFPFIYQLGWKLSQSNGVRYLWISEIMYGAYYGALMGVAFFCLAG